MTEGLEVLVQLVMAAITTAPSLIVLESPFDLMVACFSGPGKASWKFLRTPGRSTRSCGPLGAGHGGRHGREVELERVGV